MDAPPPLPSRAKRFQGWLRVGLCMVALGAIISATQYDQLLECSLSPLLVIGQKTLPPFQPHANNRDILWRVWKVFCVITPVFVALLIGAIAGFTSLYIAFCWRSSPRATWLASYAFFCTGVLMVLGLALRWQLGERVAMHKGYALRAYFLLWPGVFFALSGSYARLFRTGVSPLPAFKSARRVAS